MKDGGETADSGAPILFTLSGAKRNEPAIEDWFAAKPSLLASMARTWFERMRGCGPDVRELLHDGCPVACVQDAAFAYVNVFSSHVNVGFFNGAHLDDPAGLLEGSGKRMRHVKLRPAANPDVAALGRLIEVAYVDVKRRIA